MRVIHELTRTKKSKKRIVAFLHKQRNERKRELEEAELTQSQAAKTGEELQEQLLSLLSKLRR